MPQWAPQNQRMTSRPTTEFGSKVPPPNCGRANRRSSGRVSVAFEVVGGLVVGAAVVGVVTGCVVVWLVVGAWLTVLVWAAVVELEAGGAGVAVSVAVVASSGATLEDGAAAWPASPPSSTEMTSAGVDDVGDGVAASSAEMAEVAVDVAIVDARVSTPVGSGWEHDVMASPIARTAIMGLERIRLL